MYTSPKGITRTLQVEVEQVSKHLEIEIDLSLSGKVNGQDFTKFTCINLSQKEAQVLIDKLMPFVKPGKIIINRKTPKL